MSTATQAVQLNVRMERRLRNAGNDALASKGWSPSEFIRAAWEQLAARGPAFDALLEAVQGDSRLHAEQTSHAADALGEDALLATTARLWESLCSYAAASPSSPDRMIDAPLRQEEEDAVFEYYLIKEGVLKPWQTLDDISEEHS